MTSSFKLNKEFFEKKWGGQTVPHDFDKDHSNTPTPFIDNLHIFYLNPEKSKERRTSMLYQFQQSGINMDLVERVEPTKYPSVADRRLKNDIISWDHINMWQKAFDRNLDGALFFEDDIYFLKNWKVLVQTIVDTVGSKNVHILRFDPAPLISVDGVPENRVGLVSSKSFACLGGYYMSRDVITTALTFVKTHQWKWDTIETLVRQFSLQYFKNSSLETVPRICIQNWFMGNGSALQENEHMQKLKDVQCSGYLQRYHHLYMFDDDTQKIMNDVVEEYKNSPKYEEIIV